MKHTSSVISLLLIGSAAIAADPFPVDPPTLRKLSRPFPYKAEFSNRVSFRLPDTLRFVTEDKLPEFVDRMKLALAGDEVGVVAPDDMTWYTLIVLIKDDPLAGQDVTTLNKDSIATWNEKFTSDHTARIGTAGKTWRLGNWTHTPTWDAEKKTLSFGTRMTTENNDVSHDLMNYKIFVYGPDKQIVCLQTVTPVGAFRTPVERTKKLVEEVTFPTTQVEASPNEEMMYYSKLIGGGLIGAVVVVVLARMLMSGNRQGVVGAARRPGLPR